MIYLVFFLIFPTANSLLDWFSVSATRRLMRWWVGLDGSAGATFRRYYFGVIFDLALAVIAVCLLAGLFSAGIFGLNAVLAEFPGSQGVVHLDWMAQVADFRDDPLGRGLMVTLMLFSTLVPTLFHLGAGTAALVKLPHLGRDYVVRALENGPPVMGDRVGVGMVMAAQKIIPYAAWGAVGLLFIRFFIPMAWVPEVAEDKGFLLLWLPYEVSAWVWTALGGAMP